MSKILTGDQKLGIMKKLSEIGRQVLNQDAYGFDPEALDSHLQRAIEGRFQQEVRRWTKVDGVIRFTLVSNGMTGPQWIAHLEGRGLRVGDYAKSVLRSPDFKPTKAGTVYNVEVLMGELFTDSSRITKKIRAEAKRRDLRDPHAEVACLIRDTFSDEEMKEMGLGGWIVAMHEPIRDSDGDLGLLGAYRDVYDFQLNAYYGYPGAEWNREAGFAFVFQQVSPQG